MRSRFYFPRASCRGRTRVVQRHDLCARRVGNLACRRCSDGRRRDGNDFCRRWRGDRRQDARLSAIRAHCRRHHDRDADCDRRHGDSGDTERDAWVTWFIVLHRHSPHSVSLVSRHARSLFVDARRRRFAFPALTHSESLRRDELRISLAGFWVGSNSTQRGARPQCSGDESQQRGAKLRQLRRTELPAGKNRLYREARSLRLEGRAWEGCAPPWGAARRGDRFLREAIYRNVPERTKGFAQKPCWTILPGRVAVTCTSESTGGDCQPRGCAQRSGGHRCRGLVTIWNCTK